MENRKKELFIPTGQQRLGNEDKGIRPIYSFRRVAPSVSVTSLIDSSYHSIPVFIHFHFEFSYFAHDTPIFLPHLIELHDNLFMI